MHRPSRSLVSLLLALILGAGGAAAAEEPAIAPAAAPAAAPAQALATGDAAWRSGDRGGARRAWKQAATDPTAPPHVVAMAELRLLRVSGGPGLAMHGPRADKALAACSIDDPWCSLAWADRAATVSELGLSEQRDQAREILDALGSWADDQRQADVAAAVAERRADLDRGPVPGPGTWTLGLGALAAPGLGVGPLLRFVHPDIAWKGWRAEVGGHATTGGSLRLAAGLTTRGRWWITTGGAVERVPVPRYTLDGQRFASPQVLGLRARAGAGLTFGPLSLWAGPQARVDTPDGGALVQGHGGFGGIALQPDPRLALRLTSDVAIAGPDHLGLRGELIGRQPAGRTVLAGRLITDLTPLSTSPTWREAAWGGGEVLRHAPLGRLRGPVLGGLVAEWRLPVTGPLGVVLLGEGAVQLPEDDAPAQVHGGGGAGLRLVLPPRPHNTVRLDVAAGSLGWALTAGWGEAF